MLVRRDSFFTHAAPAAAVCWTSSGFGRSIKLPVLCAWVALSGETQPAPAARFTSCFSHAGRCVCAARGGVKVSVQSKTTSTALYFHKAELDKKPTSVWGRLQETLSCLLQLSETGLICPELSWQWRKDCRDWGGRPSDWHFSSFRCNQRVVFPLLFTLLGSGLDALREELSAVNLTWYESTLPVGKLFRAVKGSQQRGPNPLVAFLDDFHN